MAFIESPRFPDALSYWMEGGRGFQTVVTETYGGNEYRNAAWSQARGEWQAKGEALRSLQSGSSEYYVPLRNLFRVCRGQLNGFRFKDWFDYKDDGAGVLGTTGLAVGATLAYQMFKNYSVSPATYQQKVLKPVASTIKVYVDGVLQTLTTDYTLDATAGVVTFVSQPTVGKALTWTGEFDIPVRFASDVPRLGPDSTGGMLDWAQLRVIEIRNP